MYAGMHAALHSIVAEAFDGLLLATVHVYLPLISPVTFRVWRYSAVVGFTSHRCGVSSPIDSGSRSTSGDTGEGELRTGSISAHSQCKTTRY